jgi:hypothetical protein
MNDSATSKVALSSGVEIPRNVPINKHRFMDYFKGFDKVNTVKEIFGIDTEKVLSGLEVEFFSSRFGYMGVSDEDGHLFVSADYLKNGDSLGIYLDVIHELVHVKQFREGRQLFDETYEYADRPTELEAYRIAVQEARRLGMSNDEIFGYLKVTWLDESEVRRLAENVGVTLPQTQVKGRNARIR